MGLFKKLFGGDDASCEDKGSCERAARDLEGGCKGKGSADGEPVFYADGEDEAMLKAFEQARKSFRYFWRELYWERLRIVPALSFACVKVAFSQELNGSTEVEHMWVNDVYFDGERVCGVLVNDPNVLNNVKNGDEVAVPLEQISDWMFAIEGKTYGGFSVQAMRKAMSQSERAEHDEAWGLNFGDPDVVLVAYEQQEHPQNLTEHPMSVNTKKNFEEFLRGYPDEITRTDDEGYTMLHHEAIAGNLTRLELLLAKGADKNAKNIHGKTALDYARALGWDHVAEALSE
ncbi:DUF2314 domain-containing protein [uncultured Campylobacter sp.]|uniref:DUF2314 domain-containing protein n=1 Tax=uncultured Campylobacter sp. TaxID=218934 RepID=UPI0026396FA2|nr:DUF2314 domain-containing protein [uncultured Campylobacter sp.]